MTYGFLTSEDLEARIKAEFLDQVSSGDQSFVRSSVIAAREYIANHLSERYDVANILVNFLDWSSSKDYRIPTETSYVDEIGETITYTPQYRIELGVLKNRCYHDGKLWVAKRDNTNIEPGTSSDDWVEEDPRNPLLVIYCADIAMFYLFQRINPRKIPDHRIELYNEAKEWLQAVRDKEMTADLPKPIPYQDSIDFARWGSNDKQQHWW